MGRRKTFVIHASPGGLRGRGGMATFVSHLALALPSRMPGVQVGVLDTYGPGQVWLMPAVFLASLAKVLFYRMTGRLDLLHIHMAVRGSVLRKTILAFLARSIGVTTIVHIHGADFDADFVGMHPALRKAFVSVVRRCARVVVIGEHWRTFVLRHVGLDPSRVVLIYNGVPQEIATERKTSDVPELLMLGELGRRKGTPELVEALGTPELRRRRWTATLAGNGAVNEFRTTLDSQGLSDRVRVPGWVSPHDARQLLGNADIFLLPSRDEGLPMAILEAMAAAVPVIATPVGAIPDAIIDGETGILVPPGDVSALVNAIARLIDDPSLRGDLARNARSRFHLMFTLDRTADAVAELYRELGVSAAQTSKDSSSRSQ